RAVVNSCSNTVYTNIYTVNAITGTAPVGGTVSSASYCGGSNNGSLSLTGATGNVSKWQYSIDGGVVWTDISNTTTTLSYTGITATTRYRAILTNGACGTAISAVGIITVNPASVAGTATGTAAVCAGTNSTTLSLSGYTGTIQWQSSTDNNTFISIAGATNSTYIAANLSTTTYYKAVVTNASCTAAISNTVVVTVKQPSTSITTASICAGGSYSFNGTNYTTGGTYVVHKTNAVGCDSAATLVLTVNPLPPTPNITLSGAATFCAGGSVTLTSDAASSYAWTGAVATTQAITVTTSGNYSVTISDGTCTTTSAPVTVTVNPTNTITLTSVAATTSQTIYANTAITNITYATTNATGATFSGLPNGVTGNWSNNLVTISGTPAVSGVFNYTVTLNGGCGTITATGTITVASVTITSSVPTNTICAGTSVTFTATPSFANNPTYQWKKNGVAITGATNSTYTTNTLSNNDVITVDMTVANATGGKGSVVTSGLIQNLDANKTASYAGTGSTWYDISGNNNNGTLNSAVFASNSGFSYFNLSNTYISAPVSKNSSMTYNVWAKANNSLTNTNVMLFNAGNPGSGPDLFFTSLISWNIWDSNNSPFLVNSQSVSPSIIDQNWHNYTVVVDAIANNAKLYLDGVLKGTATYHISSSNNLFIGGGGDGSWSWNGAVSSFQTYNRALSASEVTTNYNALNGATSPLTSNAITTIVNALPTPSFTAQAGSNACISTNVTYTTQAGQSNYIWTVPGVMGTDYSITSGGLTSTDNTVTLRWLTGGSKVVAINYTNTSGCSAGIATNSTATLVSPASVGGTASAPSSSICYGTNTSVSVTGYTGTIQWQQSTDGLTNWTNVSGGSGSTSSTYTTSNLSATTYYRAAVTSGACSTDYSSTVMVQVNPTSVGGTIIGSATICAGTNNTTLSLSGYIGNVTKWQSSTSSNFASATDINNTTASLIATNLSTTTYYRALVTSGVCSSTFSAFATVTVNPLPTATIIGTNEVCKNTSAPNITFTGAAGTAPYTFTYTINSGTPQTVVSTGNTATIAASTATNGIYTYNLLGVQDASTSTCYQSQNGSAIVTIDTLPTATITAGGPISFCAGGSVTLNASPGISYLWSNSANTATTTISAAGSYTVTVTNGKGCSATSIPTVVTVYALPVVAGSSQPGAFGNGLNFNGINNSVVTTLPSNLDENNKVTTTWEAWIYPTSNDGNWRMIMSVEDGGWDRFLAMNGGKFYLGYGCNGWNPTTIDLNQWQHVAVVYNEAANQIIFYKNGVAYNFTIPNGCSHTSNVKFGIGCSQQSGPTQFFSGTIDEVRVWNVARTQSQIQAAMNSELSGTESGLQAYYKFDQGIAGGNNVGLTTLNDNSTGGHNGTLNNFALTGLTSNWIAGANSTGGATALGNVCVNSTLQLTNTATGGVWSSANAAIATVDNTGLVTGISAGSTIISYTVTNSNNCSVTVTNNITVNPLPTATISGTISVCQNATSPSITFTGANATAPYTFSYTINGGAIQTVTTTSDNSVTVAAPTGVAGTYTYALVSVKDASTTTCTNSVTGTATVTVNALPTATISGTAAVCQNATNPVISVTGAGGTPPYTIIYRINNDSTQSIVTTGNTATILAPTSTAGTFTYTLVSVQDASTTACTNSITGSATITVNALPTATISGTTAVCLDNNTPNITFTGANGTAPYTFSYKVNGGAMQTVVSLGTTATVGVPTSAAGIFTYTLVSVQDASSTSCVNAASGSATVIVNSPSASTTVIKVPFGGSYLFNGVTYSATGIYTAHLVNAVGCDSIATLN
ncbi:beta strand repeat-containing protein, partial [Parasediminibacterium paludis]